MARSDYAHWNEDQDAMWWLEEGRFGSEGPPYCDVCGINHVGDCPDDIDDEEEDDEEEDDDPECTSGDCKLMFPHRRSRHQSDGDYEGPGYDGIGPFNDSDA